MSISDLIVKVIGIILALVGLGLLLSAVGVSALGVHLDPVWLAVLVGLLFLAAGVYLIRGGTITL